jgi:DNA-directed RNA polymerase subunit E'/Rpb7
MYYLVSKEDTVRIPPDRLGEDLDTLVGELTHTTFEAGSSCWSPTSAR